MIRREFLLLPLAMSACATKQPVVVPIDQLFFPSAAKPSENLVLLLPGIGDQPEVFFDEGFVQAVRERNIDADLVAIRAHWGYYEERVIVERLQRDVIAPARAKGYKKFWFVGVSLGGWGTLQYVRQHEVDVTGMLLLAPFLGEQKIFQEVQAAGGLDNWRPQLTDPLDTQRLVMAWLRDFRQMESPRKLYLSFGSNDRFAKPLNLYATRLPSHQVDVISGGHDWRTWRHLWRRFLDDRKLLAA